MTWDKTTVADGARRRRWRTTTRNFTTPCGPASSARGRRDSRADHPARHAAEADARRARAERREIRRRRPLRRRAAFRHRFRQGRGEENGRPHRLLRAEGRLLRGADLGAGGRRLGDGRRGRPQEVPRRGQESLRHRQADARDRHPPDRRRPHRFLRRRRGLGQGPGGQHQEDRRDVPRGRQDRRRIMARCSPPKARSAGAACSPGGRT